MPDARAWCDAAQAAGYLRPQSQYDTPVLAMTVRKVEATSASDANKGGDGTAAPTAPAAGP
jgi:hypothetical protein